MLGDRGEVHPETHKTVNAHSPDSHARMFANSTLDYSQMFNFLYQIIDPFVEVEIIGLPVDCCKEQTRVVDDNGEKHIHLKDN